MKIKGDELKLWMDTAWPGDDWCWDHDLFDAEPEADAVYDTDEIGDVHFQGSGSRESLRLDSLLRKWRKARDFEVMTYHVPKAKADEFKAMAKSLGAMTAKLEA